MTVVSSSEPAAINADTASEMCRKDFRAMRTVYNGAKADAWTHPAAAFTEG